ncbi:WD repeat-containing protein 36 [Arachis ipaensis]|uniref:WD repeat-containing protein 36 n=1 Tax=Arachis ipaensis TaxID=130454 RepID=UPI000A2B2B75|nr:WD repeat-containing protein 36 [Arachis ipaensis]
MGIFEPFRAIGCITSGVPVSVQRLGTETFVTVSVGKAFQIFNISLDQSFSPSCMMHPDTYLNKVLVGSEQGPMQLWNVSTKKKIFEFKGWDSPITCCVSSPALDVVAVGCADGSIHVHNIRYDEELVTFTHSTRGSVTALSFCTDGQPLLASGGSSGVISVWNLEKKRLQSVVREAHDSVITSLHFFANEPVLMSSSADNSIKMWIFDTTDGDPRLLRFRSGHSAPPLCIKFYANGRHILSAGQDRAFRLFSVVQVGATIIYNQYKKIKKKERKGILHFSYRSTTTKLLKIKISMVDFAGLHLMYYIIICCYLFQILLFLVQTSAEIRERDWCNVVTCHMDTAQTYVWRLQNFVLGEHILNPCPENPTPVKACAISACGNFAILGTAGGWIERFNLQSGLPRGAYIDMSESLRCAHDSEVVGVACDSTNTLMISAGYQGDIKVWDFKERELKSRWEIGFSVVKIVYHRYNGLLATVANDLAIRLFDVVALRLVRKFDGHTDRITDLCFSEDGKWLLSSSMDGSLRIWDVILARQIDAIHVNVPITALSLSPNMDILATAHVDQNGVYLWVNQTMFSSTSTVDSYASGKEVVSVKLPSISSIEHSQVEELDEVVDASQPKDAPHVPTQVNQIPDLVTLSLLPKSQWQSLINLDIIKIRNKPIEPPKKPEKAPFFLPSVPSLSGEILFEPGKLSVEERDGAGDGKQMKKTRLDSTSSRFLHLLQSSNVADNYGAFTDYIKGLSPSTLDMELRMLQIIDDNDDEQGEKRPELVSIEQLMDYFIHELSCRNNFEFLQAVIRLFLKIHGETIRQHSHLQEKARKLLDIQCNVWQRVDKMFQSVRCVVGFLSNSHI